MQIMANIGGELGENGRVGDTHEAKSQEKNQGKCQKKEKATIEKEKIREKCKTCPEVQIGAYVGREQRVSEKVWGQHGTNIRGENQGKMRTEAKITRSGGQNQGKNEAG